ncbi:MAG: insulinase family protein [Lachnospiraceae bacterium]|nr:insulinase family protein [Lachnospiraceae bacterium]
MNIKDLTAYELIEERQIDDLLSKGYILKHKKSGARVVLLSNDDENKVFYIGFRTPPANDTGLPHILEHSVLCGSKKYPAKDPFVELCKGSLNTFLNAMTYPDKTVYPVASCNLADFKNIMDVYLDAVFYPNIYAKQEIFKQEGWHYELENEDANLIYNGVVYNEMRGAFSSPEGVLDRTIMNSIFPDNCYSKESGGDPKSIPDLSYEEFLDFHKTYYHPANSYIYLYGDMDMVERLEYLDKEYLSAFEAITLDSSIKPQVGFETPIELVKEYSITEEQANEDNAYLSYNMVIGTSLDKQLYLAFQVLEYALLTAPGATLKKALLDAGVGQDVYATYENGILQPMFSIVAANSTVDKKEEFISTIKNVLKNIVTAGFDKKLLLAGINSLEFRYREADFGRYPKGLMYGLQALDSWLYDDLKPFVHIEALDTFAFLKKQVETDYYEKLVDEYLINNTHASVVILAPKVDLTTAEDEKIANKLEEYKKTLSQDKIDTIIADTKALKKYQEEPSTKEEIESIPMIKVSDIKKEALPLCNKELDLNGFKLVHHDINTNGVAYLTMSFDLKSVPNELVQYLGILKLVMGYVSTKSYSYGDLANEININTGGFNTSICTYEDIETGENTFAFEVKAKYLYEKTDFVLNILNEIIYKADYGDYKRIKELMTQGKSRMQSNFMQSGHSIAVAEASANFSVESAFSNAVSKLDFYRFIDKLLADFENCKADIVAKLKKLVELIFVKDNLIISYCADELGLASLKGNIALLEATVPDKKYATVERTFVAKHVNKGVTNSSQVQYVARCGNFKDAGFEYTGALSVLKTILGYDYLWINVRVQGGAYGCMSGFSKYGNVYFVSYRDPKLEKTNEIFENMPKYLEKFDADKRDMEKYIIGTMGELDAPLTPSAKAARSFIAYRSNTSYERIQKNREEVLNTNVDTIRGLKDMIKAVLEQNYLCVVGNKDKVKECDTLFDEITNMF